MNIEKLLKEVELKENLPYLESREIKKIVIEFSREQDKMN